MGIKTVQDTSLTSVANAIRVKAEISGTLEFPDEFVSAIQNISTGITPSGTKTITENGTYDVTNFASADVNVSGGGASVPPKEVNFYDYDGTVVDAYTATEFANLSAMPANPTHDGLTAQGWNWSLADAKAYVAKYGRLNIGQMYVTTSGDTEIDIQLGIGRNKPYLGCCPNGTVEIDWGDGSAHDTLTGTSTSTLKSIQHTYPDTGEMFTIKLHMESGSLGFIENSSSGSQVLYNGTTGQTNGQRAYQNAVKAIRCGSHATSISGYAFYNCYSLTSVTIPESITSIGNYAFNTCYSLTSVTIPDGVTSISGDTFSSCYSLTSVTMPKSVTSIGGYAFDSCYSLASVTIPEGVTSIGNYAFNNCYSLTSVTIPESITNISSNAFSTCRSLTSVTIPESVTSISSNAFSGCYSLTSVTIPDGVTSISGYAFDSCRSLTSVTIPEGVTSIGNYAFNSCYSLTSVTIPEGVTSIGNSAFSTCRSLASLAFEPTNPPTAGSSAFNSLPSDLVVYVPNGTLSAYQAASNYSSISSKMVEMSA